MGTWRLLEHTADLSLEGEGKTPDEALLALCDGLSAQIAQPPSVRPLQTRTFSSSGFDREEAVVGFLGELLFAAFGQGWLPGRCEGISLAETAVEGRFSGEPFDPGRHRLSEIKAATRHGYSFARDADGFWRVRVIFDV